MIQSNKTIAPQLIVMLTHNDYTVENAEDIFESCKNSKASLWGMKEKPLPLSQMKSLYAKMKKSGVTTVLEVVGYDEASGLAGAKMAAECGCDILMGTMFQQSIADFCHTHDIFYMPFVGKIEGRPSILTGDIPEIIKEAQEIITLGADGIDLLGYRYTGDAKLLNEKLVKSVNAPVCIAGSIDSFERLDEVECASPHSFTIGSAFFNGCFGTSFIEQINAVVDYLAAKH